MKKNKILEYCEEIENTVKKIREEFEKECNDDNEVTRQQIDQGVPDPPVNPGGHGNG